MVARAENHAASPRARRVLLLALSALGTLALVELGLRWAQPFRRDFPLYPGERTPGVVTDATTTLDDELGWRFTPHAEFREQTAEFDIAYRCTDEGFRAVEGLAQAGAARSIVFVGDSFTFGTGVEEPEIFVERVAASCDVRAYNYGMAGYGVDQMWRALVTLGTARQPDVVVALFVLDDLNRSLTAYRDRKVWASKPLYALDGERLVRVTESNAPGALTRFFERSTYLAEAWRRLTRRVGLEHGCGQRFELNRHLFLAMRDACAAVPCEFLVVHLPQRGAAWRPLPALAESFERDGVPYLDLGALPVADSAALYFRVDPHLNAAGHAFVAQAISDRLTAERWLEGAAR